MTALSSPKSPGGARSGRAGWLLIAAPLLLTAVAYRSLLNGYFFSDDFLNLYRIVNGDLLEYLLTPHGGHLLWTRNAVFYLCFQAFADRAELYFALVLATHLLNVGLFFLILRRWTNSAATAAFAAALWGTCPVQSGALEWYAVYGQVLAATVLLVLLTQLSATRPDDAPPRAAPWLWPLLLLAASTCFGVGLGIAVAFPFVAFLLLPASRARRRLCVVLAVLAVAMPFFYRGALLLNETLYGASAEVFNASLAYRYFDLERSSTLLVQLLAYGVLRPLLGFVFTPRSFDVTVLYAALASFLVLTAIALANAPRAVQKRALALLLLAAAAYGTIALGRGAIFDVQHAAGTERYHYLGTIPLTLLLGLVFAQIAARARAARVAIALLACVWLAIDAASFARMRRPFLFAHVAARREVTKLRATVEKSVRAAPPGAAVYIDNQPFRAIGPVLIFSKARFPGWAAAFTILYPSNVVAGHRIYFVDDDPNVLKQAREGKRTADLIVAAAPGAAAPP